MAVSRIHHSLKGLSFGLAGLLLGAAGSVHAQAPIGTLQIDQRVQITASGSDSALRVSNSGYTVQSGDRIQTSQGSAVIAVQGNGGLGLGPESDARIELSEAGDIQVLLEAGTLMYSLPAGQGLTAHAGEFVVSLGDSATRRVDVSNRPAAHGVIQRMESGQIRVAVRDGDAVVQAGSGHAYPVSAGQQRGFRVSSSNELMVQDTEIVQVLIDIQAPEQVEVRQQFNVRWSTGEEFREGDFLTIAPVGAEDSEFESVASTSVGEVLEFEAPGSPGDYEIRYIDGETGEIRSFVYLEVVRDRIVAYWWRDPRWIGGLAAVTGGAVYLATRDDSDEEPQIISP
ncbi:MAG: hypothetical protein ACXIUB_05780 [Wenzhouxiangella sp.]